MNFVFLFNPKNWMSFKRWWPKTCIQINSGWRSTKSMFCNDYLSSCIISLLRMYFSKNTYNNKWVFILQNKIQKNCFCLSHTHTIVIISLLISYLFFSIRHYSAYDDDYTLSLLRILCLRFRKPLLTLCITAASTPSTTLYSWASRPQKTLLRIRSPALYCSGKH